MKAGTHNHVKVKRLKRLLGVPLYRAVGILETLWLLCADCCDEGNIGKFTDDEIADYLEWDGSASELVRCLSDSGWTDQDTTGRPVIHDWFEHCPEYIRDRVRKRKARAGCSNGIRTYDASKSDKSDKTKTDTGLDPATTVYSKPNPTNNSIGASARKSNRASKSTEPDGFAEWYQAYPRHEARAAATKPYETAVNAFMVRDHLERPMAVATLLAVTKAFSASEAGKSGPFTPLPATWLNAARYFDDQTCWNREEQKPKSAIENRSPGEKPNAQIPSIEEARRMTMGSRYVPRT